MTLAAIYLKRASASKYAASSLSSVCCTKTPSHIHTHTQMHICTHTHTSLGVHFPLSFGARLLTAASRSSASSSYPSTLILHASFHFHYLRLAHASLTLHSPTHPHTLTHSHLAAHTPSHKGSCFHCHALHFAADSCPCTKNSISTAIPTCYTLCSGHNGIVIQLTTAVTTALPSAAKN